MALLNCEMNFHVLYRILGLLHVNKSVNYVFNFTKGEFYIEAETTGPFNILQTTRVFNLETDKFMKFDLKEEIAFDMDIDRLWNELTSKKRELECDGKVLTSIRLFIETVRTGLQFELMAQ